LTAATTAIGTLWTEIQTFLLAQGALVFGVLAVVGVVFMLFRKGRQILGARSTSVAKV